MQFFGGRLCAQRQPQHFENAAAGLRHNALLSKHGASDTGEI